MHINQIRNTNSCYSSATGYTSFTSARLTGIKRKALDVNSVACKFFGVDSRENISKQLENQINLIRLKCKQNGIISSFPRRAYFSVDKLSTMKNAWNKIWNRKEGNLFEGLCYRPARLTFDGKFFGENGEEGAHTVGILYNPITKTLFCLDSLSNNIKGVKKYQNILKKHIFNSPNNEIRKIIFSNKPQQNLTEFTCNNWTIANLEILQKALWSGKIVDSVEKLNELLLDDINKILKEQRSFVLKNM